MGNSSSVEGSCHLDVWLELWLGEVKISNLKVV